MRPAIGFKPVRCESRSYSVINPDKNWARWDGQPKRCPKKGELYLSGSTPTAYIAPNDLSTEYYIAVRINGDHLDKCPHCRRPL